MRLVQVMVLVLPVLLCSTAPFTFVGSKIKHDGRNNTITSCVEKSRSWRARWNNYYISQNIKTAERNIFLEKLNRNKQIYLQNSTITMMTSINMSVYWISILTSLCLIMEPVSSERNRYIRVVDTQYITNMNQQKNENRVTNFFNPNVNDGKRYLLEEDLLPCV